MAEYPSVGATFGNYRITGLLGEGGMGIVYAATRSGLNRRVALKVLSPELAGQPRFRKRFTAEASALASLYSPHIVDIYEHGELEGCLFIATPLVGGGDLKARLRQAGPLPAATALDLLAQVSSALSDAHGAGVLHRDVKPSNVLLHETADGELFAYLCDFGIAQTQDEDRTRTGGLMGTLAYVAPERHEGAEATMATDIYSLGCLFWETLSGRPPYEGTDVQVAMQHLHGPIPAYDGPQAEVVNPLLQRLMAKSPTNRYPSAHEVREDVVRAMRTSSGESPTQAGAVAAVARFNTGPRSGVDPAPDTSATGLAEGGDRRSPRRRRLAIVAAALLTLLAIAGVSGQRWIQDTQDPSGSTEQPEASTTADIQCWDGVLVDEPAECSSPVGVAGLRWVFPSFPRDFMKCHPRFGTRDESLRSWYCPIKKDPGDGIAYTVWVSAEAAQESYDKRYLRRPVEVSIEGHPVGLRWWRTSRNENGFLKTTFAYHDLPFSASIYASTMEGLRRVCSVLTVREPETFAIRPPDCATDVTP